MELPREDDLSAAFSYLDVLRQSGVTNMYGAAAYLMDHLEMKRPDAVWTLGRWMETFDANTSADDRARRALERAIAKAKGATP